MKSYIFTRFVDALASLVSNIMVTDTVVGVGVDVGFGVAVVAFISNIARICKQNISWIKLALWQTDISFANFLAHYKTDLLCVILKNAKVSVEDKQKGCTVNMTTKPLNTFQS